MTNGFEGSMKDFQVPLDEAFKVSDQVFSFEAIASDMSR